MLKIPWKNLYSEPVVAEIDGLYLLVRPNSGKYCSVQFYAGGGGITLHWISIPSRGSRNTPSRFMLQKL